MTRAQYNWVPVPVPAAAPQDETKPPAEQGPPTPPEAPEVTSTSKFQGQFPAAGSMGQKVVQLEHEHVGRDFSLTLKAVNPSVTSNAPAAPQPMGLGGVPETYSVAFMQAFSSSLALGGEYAIPRSGDEPAVTLALKYAPRPSEPIPAPPVLPSGMPSPYMPVNPKDPGQVFTTSYSPSTGLIHSTYWRRLNQRLEMATEAQLLVSGGDARGIGRREGLATVGFKLDTLFASVRGSVDTHGRVATLLEERIAQGMALHLSGEIDFGRGNGGVGKVGIGFTMEM